MILQNGQWYDDPDGPHGGEFDQRIPCSGAAIGNGTLLLIEVDGRQPERSVGLTRPEFAALMRALGGWDGIAFDGGGSSTLAVRTLGDPLVALQNSPSDGVERRVADGVFVYNDAPAGPADRLVGSPNVVRAVPGATIALHFAAIDANDHAADADALITADVEPATLGKIVEGNFFVASGTGSGIIRLHSGLLHGAVAVHVEAAPDRLLILPPDPNVVAHGNLLLTARAFDSEGFELALPEHLHWNASDGEIDDRGHWAAGEHDAQVTLDIGGRIASAHVSVGSHEVPIDVVLGLHFLSVPGGGEGTAQPDTSCDGCIQLDYALGPQERAGYAIVERPLPAGTIGLSFDLHDDGSGAMLRIALRNAINEQVLVTASSLDRPGSRRVVVHFPPGLAQPLHLVGFYAIGSNAEDVHSGSVVIGDVHALVAGSTP